MKVIASAAVLLLALFYFRPMALAPIATQGVTAVETPTESHAALAPAPTVRPQPHSPEKLPARPAVEEKRVSATVFTLALRELEAAPDAEETSDVAHEAPASVGESGHIIGKLIELADRQSSARRDTLQTFVSCAESQTAPVTVRAHCFASTVRMAERWQMFVPLTEAHVTTEVQRLAAKLLSSTHD